MASICQEPQLQSLDSLFSPFSDRDKLEHITEILNQYSLHGIPEISMTPSIKRASSIQEQQSSPSGDGESGIIRRSIDTLDTDTVTLREKKSRTPSMLSSSFSSSTKLANQSSLSAGSSSGFNTLTTNQSTLSADGGGRSPNSSVRRKSYQPPASSQQAMQEVFQSNRPGSYQESSTTVVQSSIPLNVTPSASIEENVITIDPDDSDLYIETNWRDLVTDWESVLSKRSLGQMDAFWELLYTEVFYIKHLRIIHNLFHVCLSNLQKEGLLLDVSIISILITYSD